MRSSPENANARPAQDAHHATTNRPSTREATDHNTSATRNRPPLAWFSQHRPAGRRRTWLQFVAHCPRCHGAHVHRSPEPVRGGWRTGSCGMRYRLTPIRPSRMPRPRTEAQLVELRSA